MRKKRRVSRRVWCGGCLSACVGVRVLSGGGVCVCVCVVGGGWEVIKIAMKVTIGVINTVVFRVSAALKLSHYLCW